VLVVLAWTLHARLRAAAPTTMRVATSVALVWAGVLIAGGMATNLGMETVVALHADDPARAATVWLAIETITSGMTGANGELLGGLWTLLVSLAARRARALPGRSSSSGWRGHRACSPPCRASPSWWRRSAWRNCCGSWDSGSRCCGRVDRDVGIATTDTRRGRGVMRQRRRRGRPARAACTWWPSCGW
jgi:hypothetical protein